MAEILKEHSRNVHWGQWIWGRAVAIGFRTKKTLAAEIGCAEQQLGAWLRMEIPPLEMRKGFDAALCVCLRTDRKTLFVDFGNLDPATAPVASNRSDAPARREIIDAAERLQGDRLNVLNATARALLSGSAA